MNRIQYISTAHTTKDEAKSNKRKCNSLHNVYYKELPVSTIADLLESGMTIGRVGTTTEFVAIDIDHTSVHITDVLEAYKDNPDVYVSFSSSNHPLKYHILVDLHRTITVDEYKDVLQTEFEKIRNKLCGRSDFMELDKNAGNFYQCFFGTPAYQQYEHIIPGSKRLFGWVKKDCEPHFYIEKEKYNHFPLNTAEYCKQNGLSVMNIDEPKRYDVILPSMTHGRLKQIAEGHRYNWCKRVGAQLLLRCLYCNHSLGGEYTKFDYLKTFEYVVKRNVVKCNEFINSDDYKGLERFFDNKWDILADKSWEFIESTLSPYFKCSTKRYKIKKYNSQTSSEIITEHQINDSEILFTDREELETICNNSYISIRYFTDYCKKLKLKVVFECVDDRKSKHDCCKGMSIEQFDEYCKSNKLSRQMKSKLKVKYGIVR